MKYGKASVAGSILALLSAAHPANAANLVVNGDFAAGNTGFTSDYSFASTIYSQNQYTIGTQPENAYNAYFGSAANFPPPSGATSLNMMLVNGGFLGTNTVWAESGIAVSPDTNYYFSAYITNLDTASPATLDFSINGSALGTTFTAATAVGTWSQFFATWNSGSSTTADLGLVDTNTSFGGNDFALDLISLSTSSSGGVGVGGSGTTVPEPASWALMIVGFAGLGIAALARSSRRGLRSA